jgi:ribosomal protein S18 acetylase RimI-like enzyme
MEVLVSHATGRVELLQLSVASDNEAAFQLYKKMGFF